MSIFDFDMEKELEKLPVDEQGIGYGTGLRIGMQVGMNMGIKLGSLRILFELVQDRAITPVVAARKAGMKTEEFKEEMKRAGYSMH